MKALAAFLVSSLFVVGCASVRTSHGDFVSLHGLVKQRLANSCSCGPIVTNEVIGGRYFEVSPQPRGLQVTVSERQFLSQKEWARRYSSGTNRMSQFMEAAKTNHPIGTNHSIDAKTAERLTGVTNFFGLSDLPEWSYQSTGVDVRVQEVDEVYPGLQEDSVEAEKCYKEIVKLLRPYHRANQAGAVNAPIASWFQFGHPCRRVTEQRR